jgi:hypothetical protein
VLERSAPALKTESEITVERDAYARIREAFRSDTQRDIAVREAARSEWLRTHRHG